MLELACQDAIMTVFTRKHSVTWHTCTYCTDLAHLLARYYFFELKDKRVEYCY